MGTQFTMSIGNDAAGGDTNLATVNFFNNDAWEGSSGTGEIACLVAFAHYMLPAADTYIAGISAGDSAGGGQIALEFPDSAYATFVAADSNLTPMTDWGVRYGTGALAPLGAGAVVTRRTATLGRKGRGRFTTPWLPASGVDAAGSLLTSSGAVVLAGWNLYMRDVDKFDEYLNSSLGLKQITTVTVADRLGRVKTRTR